MNLRKYIYKFIEMPEFIEQVNQYATNPVVRELVDTYEFHILPNMNPDGSEVLIMCSLFLLFFFFILIFILVFIHKHHVAKESSAQ